MTEHPAITTTRRWLEHFVIAYDICPFARREHQRGSIRYRLVTGNSLEFALETLISECLHLDAEPETETTLLIFNEDFQNFDDFLDLLAIAEQLLSDQDYEGIYQLASFHPDYCFDCVDAEDAANYTNRAPFPMLHLIREASIAAALAHYAHPETIPERNIALTRRMGVEKLRDILAGCFQDLE